MSEKIKENLAKLFSLEGKVALVTGAAGGIGSELCRGLAGAGATVCLCDLTMEGLSPVEEEICGEGGVADSFLIDMLDLSSIRACVKSIVEKHGSIDVLVNCAGINKREGQLDGDEATYDRIMGVNLKGVYFLSQEVGKQMVAQKSGSIINISSYNAVMMLGGCGVYGATKSGVLALTRSQAVEWAKHGIRSNALCPGHIKTPLSVPQWTDPVRTEYLLDRIAMNRPGLPSDLVGTAILLASDASAYITGAAFHVDGGCLAGGQPWPYDTAY